MVTLQLDANQYDLITGALTICEQMAIEQGHLPYQMEVSALHEELERQWKGEAT